MFNTYEKVAITDSIDLTALTVSNKQFCKHNIFISLSFCLHLMHCYKNVYWTWKFSFHYFSIQIFNFEVWSFKCDSTKWGNSLQVVWGAYFNTWGESIKLGYIGGSNLPTPHHGKPCPLISAVLHSFKI